MKKEEVKNLKYEIGELKKLNIEEFIFMLKYYLKTWILCILNFGPFHNITKDCNKAFKEIYSIFKEEEILCDFLLEKSKDIDFYEACKFKDKLDGLNEETILYYVELLDDIMTACETNQEFRATRPRKYFDSLIETDEYRKELYGLTLNLESIKEYLNYPQEFWDYVMPKVRIVFEEQDNKSMNYEVIMKLDNNNSLQDMRVIVPEINNLISALINIHEFKHAYDLYNMLGMNVPDDIDYFEKSAKEVEDNFTNEYMLRLIK